MRTNLWFLPLAAAAALVFSALVLAAGGSGVSGIDRLTVVAGSMRGGQVIPGFSGDGGPATRARMHAPWGVAVDRDGDFYIADKMNNRVRKVTACGTITTIAGTGVFDFSGDGGPAISAALRHPGGVAVDEQRNVYVGDSANARVRKITPGGMITTIAGNGRGGFSGDGGPATSARLSPSLDGLAVDAQGSVYIADFSNLRIRKVSANGTITTVAGGGASLAEGVRATEASLGSPVSVAVDRQHNLYVFAFSPVRALSPPGTNMLLRKVSPDGTIRTVAGARDGGVTPRDGVSALKVRFSGPSGGGVVVDAQGNIYISTGDRVHKVSGGIITSVVAGGARTFPPDRYDGPARPALVAGWLAVDRPGNLYISHADTNRVFKVWKPQGSSPPKLTLTAASPQRPLTQHGITLTADCNESCSLAATGSIRIPGTAGPLRLTRASTGLRPAGCARTFTVRFANAAQERLFRQLVRPGVRATAAITVRASDVGGHAATATRSIALLP
jgi:hypothetical protein